MAERNLTTLLKTLKVTRRPGLWTFEALPKEASSWTDLVSLRHVKDIAMLFQEEEGLTVIARAESDTVARPQWVWLELSVYSDLEAVGFLAEIAAALTRANVPCNAVAAFHHDHIFVPVDKADAAIEAIMALATTA